MPRSTTRASPAMSRLLKKGRVDVNGRNERGWTPLLLASAYGHLEVVALLLTANADPNSTEANGLTPLHKASAWGQLQIVELLLKANADPSAVTKDGETLLHKASANGHWQVVDLLLKANTDPQVATKNGAMPLHFASEKGHVQVVECLVANNADPNAVDKDGKTPLHDACHFHNSDVVRVLLAFGADLHATDPRGCEPLHCCLDKATAFFTNKLLKTLHVLVSFGAAWDAACDAMVNAGDAYQEAPALRICMSLWAQEHVDGLELSDVPFDVIKRGVKSTQTFVDELKNSTEIILRRKICLVGSSCAGKTSLVKSMTANQPQLVHVDDRTIGIDHFPHRFQQVIPSRSLPKTHEVTFWDFAGQDAYQVAHSLFFSPRTLFLVCVDLEAFTTAVLQASIMANFTKQETQLMDEFIERTVMHWIRLIVARQPDAEFVFIVTKEDLLVDNDATKQLFKTRLTAQLKVVETTVQHMRDQLKQDARRAGQRFAFGSEKSVGAATSEPTIVFASCTSPASVNAARKRIEDLIVQSKRSFTMPDTYSKVLDAIVAIRQSAKANAQDATSRITRVFAPLATLPAQLNIEPDLCRTILQTLHDLGDVLWYEDLGVELFENTVILDPLLLIDFIRQVINHTHTGVTISHADLAAKPFWRDLSSETQMKAMKQVLQKFRLVYPDDERRVMHWDSDLIVPAFWQTKTPASWLFLGDILRINATKSCDGEAVRVEWEYHFAYGLPSSLFDQVVVASVSPEIQFDAGPDWIVYEEKEIAACRIMVGRDVTTLHRTIHVEAVVAAAANEQQVEALWWSFQQLCGAFLEVMHEYPGLTGVSSFAWDDNHTKINLKRLVQSTKPSKKSTAKWMPPAATWEWFKELTTNAT